MPYTETFPLGGNGDLIQDLLRRIEVLEARTRVLSNGSLLIQNQAGQNIIIIGQLTDGTYGVEVLDASGNVQVKLGELNASPTIYGLGVRPFGASQLQQVGGFLQVTPPAVSNVTNTSPVAFPTPNSVVAEIGPSETAMVSVTASISTGDANQQGIILVAVDGGTPFTWIELSVGVTGGASAIIGSTFPWESLTPGSHTFELFYQTANNGSSTCSFSSVGMVVQPL